MRILQSSLFRALCAIVAGYLLAVYREQMLHWTTIAFGGLFFLSGLVSLITYYSEKRRAMKTAEQLEMLSELRTDLPTTKEGQLARELRPSFPIVGIGSTALGAILVLMPSTFANIMMYVVAAMLILGAVNLLFNLIGARRFRSIGWGLWMMPLLLLIVGILMVARPETFAAMPFRIMGWTMVVYGVVECVNAIIIYRYRKAWEAANDPAKMEGEQTDNAPEEEKTIEGE